MTPGARDKLSAAISGDADATVSAGFADGYKGLTLRVVDTRANLLRAGAVIDSAALDKYSFTRDVFMQVRQGQSSEPLFRDDADKGANDGMLHVFDGRVDSAVTTRGQELWAYVPRGVLADFGVTLPKDTEIRVWDSTAETRFLVLPIRPAGTEGWGRDELAALVSRNAMIGTERDLKAA